MHHPSLKAWNQSTPLHRAVRETRTLTEWFLRPLPLPLGYDSVFAGRLRIELSQDAFGERPPPSGRPMVLAVGLEPTHLEILSFLHLPIALCQHGRV